MLRSGGECAGYSRRGPFHKMERLRFPFTPNGRREFVPRDQVFPIFSVNSLLLLHKKISSFMLQSTHKMANLTQNEICAVLCSKRQYKQHDGEKMAMWNSAHCRFIKLWKSNTNTTETFTKHVLPAKVRAINRLKNTNHRTRKRQEWGGGGLRKNFCVSTRSRTRHPLYDDQ